MSKLDRTAIQATPPAGSKAEPRPTATRVSGHLADNGIDRLKALRGQGDSYCDTRRRNQQRPAFVGYPEAGHAKVTIDLASARTGDTQRDTALPQPEWFDVATHPQASFTADHFVAKGDDAYEAPGKLTIRGAAKDVVLPFTLTISGDQAVAKGHLSLMRSDFGIGQGPWSSGQWVALEVGVDVDLVATKSGS